MKRVFCIGELLVDLVSTDGQNFVRKAGGAPANVSVAISKLGGESYFLGKVGDDSFGVFLEDVLKENNVNTSHMDIDGMTTLAIVSIDKSGERSFNFYRGSDGEYVVDLDALNLTNNDIVHFGSATAFLDGSLKESYYKLLEHSKEKGALISFDPNYRDVLIEENIDGYIYNCLNFMKEADFIKLSDEEAILITRQSNLKEAIDFLQNNFKAKIAITLGKEGTLIIDDKYKNIIKSIKINQKDSTGAGDAFVGGVLYSLSNNESNFEEIIKFANVVGALTCEEYGAINAIPTLEKVKNKMSK